MLNRAETFFIVLFILSILTVSYCSDLFAETYKWTDAGGCVHFSDSPPIGPRDEIKVESSEPPRQAATPAVNKRDADNVPDNLAKYRSTVKLSGPKVYRVQMKTRFVVPSSGMRIDNLRVWHALPTKREWSGTDSPWGCSQISWIPETGQKKYEESHDSHHVIWDKINLTPGSTLSFQSQFTVRSSERKFDPKSAPISWSDYSKTALPDYDKRHDLDSELIKIADRIKSTRTPPEAVLEFCQWLKTNITYDASVSYPYNDVASTIRNRRGHCGHYSELLIQFCNRVGIPIRQVFGLNLYAKDGVTGGLHDIRPDYTNIHTWAEVYFPSVGWVEVEPSGGEQAFTIPARFIQNNPWFQNYSIWMRENGQWKQPEWQYRSGRYLSPYGIENIISYSEP